MVRPHAVLIGLTLLFGCSNASTDHFSEVRAVGGKSSGGKSSGGNTTSEAGTSATGAAAAGANNEDWGGGGLDFGGGAGTGNALVPSAGATHLGAAGGATVKVKVNVTWDQALAQAPAWYASAEAAAVAANVLYYQNVDGGWPKNIDIIAMTSAKAASTIDNNATTSELSFLARMVSATSSAQYLEAFNRGVDNLLAAQYPANGGWPQYYPAPTGYHARITYNDNAMLHVMSLLREVGNQRAPYYTFVDAARAARSLEALALGIQCLLKTQIATNGVKSAWCAQHDEVSLLPAAARAYELVSISGSESAGILTFLMSIDSPSAEVIEAVEAGVAWFNSVQLKGIRVTNAVTDAGADVVVVADPAAPPIWARFYDIGTNIAFFCGRDGIKKYSLAEIELERRTGYAWYGSWGNAVLTSYKTWQAKWAPSQNVLEASVASLDAGVPASDALDAGVTSSP